MNFNDCKPIRSLIEETDLDRELNITAAGHVRVCNACCEFYESEVKLRQMVRSLTPVAAPPDFDFRLRARLANDRGKSAARFLNSSWRVPSAAFAALVLMAGAFVVIRNVLVSNPTPPAIAVTQHDPLPLPVPINTLGQEHASVPVTRESNEITKRKGSHRRQFVANETKGRLTSKEFSGMGATSVKQNTVANAQVPLVFPVQTLKVSLDDGSGVSRTISFPTVSFGSERVLTRSNYSGKGDW